ncbi:uncharacterized protein C8A04DRAFT_11707 [Dichotomopilus funicola]|uniref:DNA replication factor Cdt1 C-terminal domain-containing protein n=1 Tax=Dichotomopilus funicola TaxID=1934379 RepID=A0AAN6V3U6_9PEZI|nr:hypothetical protein C8A04DRAFT_11707 [Dichotomopilus funicola]
MPGVITRKTRTPRSVLASSGALTKTVTGSFTKPSKAQSLGKEKLAVEPFATISTNIEIVLPTRKRKVQVEDESIKATPKKLRHREPEARAVAPATPDSRKKKSVRFQEEQTPSRASRALPPAPPVTPSSSGRKRAFDADETSQTEELLGRLNIQSTPVKRSKTTVHLRAPPNEFDLPGELLDLLDLHAAFLKTLSTQPDTTSPIDLNDLYSDITRSWGKRHVSLIDIQRCVGVLAWTPNNSHGGKKNKKAAMPTAVTVPYFLSDYGRDKFCIEFYPSSSGVGRQPLHDLSIKMHFEANLRALWLARHNNAPETVFINTLPKASLKPCAALSAAALAPKATTQTSILATFKQSVADKRQQDREAKEAAVQQKQALVSPVTGTKLSLLDRIRLKESLASSSSSQGPTPAEIQRRSALHRASDVAAVVAMLCKATVGPGGALPGRRVPFAVTALVNRLRDSMRTPIATEDGVACIRLLATEIAPEWLKIAKVGGRENVVCLMGMELTKAEVERRVAGLLA